jgi:AhpD family alkylhydroperoxidase
MTMLNWTDYRTELFARIGDLATLTPETVKGYQTLSKAGAKTGHLDAVTRELIALAVSVTTRCDGCITAHTAEAIRLGATREQVGEALGVAVALNAGAAVVYSARALDAFEAHGGAAAPAALAA